MRSSKRVFYIMVGLLVFAVLGTAADVYFGNRYLSNRSRKIVELKLESQKLEQQQTSLTKARKDVEKYQEYNDITKQIVPQDKDEVRAIREITELAAESGIKIASVSLPASTLGQKPAATSSGGSNSSNSSDSQQTKTTTAAPSVSQATPVEGITGLLQLKLIVTPASTGYSYEQFLNFLDKLEKNRRTAQIGKVTINRVESSSKLNFNLELSIFLKPGETK